VATPPVAVQTRRRSSWSTKGQRLLPTQYRGSGLAPPHHKPAGDCLASGDSDDETETDEFTLDAAAARHVNPKISPVDRILPAPWGLSLPPLLAIQTWRIGTFCVVRYMSGDCMMVL
jgi:hypothetical protein